MEAYSTKIVVYHCRNLLFFEDGEQKVFARSRPGLNLVAVPCSGKIEAHHLLKTLSAGAQGVLVCACAEKACRFIEGSMRSRKRADYARYWLQKLDIEPDRIRFVRIPPMDLEALEMTLKEFSAQLESFGTLPPVAKASTG